MLRHIGLGLVCTAMLGAGACATSYGNGLSSFTGGVGAKPIDSRGTLFEVEVGGNAYLSEKKAHDMLVLKSAETALKQGYVYYEVLTEENRSQMPRYIQTYYNGIDMGTMRVGNRTYKPNFKRYIRLLDKRSDAASADVHSAVSNYDRLAPIYIGPDAKRGIQLLGRRGD